MQTKIQRWGNSLGLRIPRSFAEEAGVEAGSQVDLSMQDGNLIVRATTRRRYRLDELLERVTTKNVHREIDTGEPIGKEVW